MCKSPFSFFYLVFFILSNEIFKIWEEGGNFLSIFSMKIPKRGIFQRKYPWRRNFSKSRWGGKSSRAWTHTPPIDTTKGQRILVATQVPWNIYLICFNLWLKILSLNVILGFTISKLRNSHKQNLVKTIWRPNFTDWKPSQDKDFNKAWHVYI